LRNLPKGVAVHGSCGRVVDGEPTEYVERDTRICEMCLRRLKEAVEWCLSRSGWQISATYGR